MNISLHIERLVLDGLSLSPGDRAALQHALQTELARLLTQGGLSPALRSGGALPALPAAQVQLGQQSHPAYIGRQVAQAVYSGLGTGDLGSGGPGPARSGSGGLQPKPKGSLS